MGTELLSKTTEKTTLLDIGGTAGGAIEADKTLIVSDLAMVINAWPTLPAPELREKFSSPVEIQNGQTVSFGDVLN